MAQWIKAMTTDGEVEYFSSLEECCQCYGIRYHHALTKLINEAGLAPDGKTFFDYPTDLEIEELNKGHRRIVRCTG